MRKIKQQIFVTFEKEGVHKYPAALTDPELVDVSFLGYPHRHKFCFVVTIDVHHDDRDIEFILFKRWLEGLYDDSILDLDFKSCEMISDDLAEMIEAKYPGRNFIISVSEDNENGSITVYGV